MNQADWLRKRLRAARRFGCAAEIGAAALLTLALAVGARTAWAVEGDDGPGGPSREKTLGDYLSDLASDEPPERLFAARTVRAEVKGALAVSRRAPPDSLAALDARSTLVEVDLRIVGSCTAGLTYPDTAPLCAELLADLEHVEMIPAISAAKEAAANSASKRRIDRALATLIVLREVTIGREPAPERPPSP